MIKRNTVRKIEKIGKSLHFHRLPGVSYLYNKIESMSQPKRGRKKKI